MTQANCDHDQAKNHAEMIMDMAMDMRDCVCFVKDPRPGTDTHIKIRLGSHSGQVSWRGTGKASRGGGSSLNLYSVQKWLQMLPLYTINTLYTLYILSTLYRWSEGLWETSAPDTVSLVTHLSVSLPISLSLSLTLKLHISLSLSLRTNISIR